MILASSSEQRLKLLSLYSTDFEVKTAHTTEIFDDNLSVYENAVNVATEKALTVFSDNNIENDIVIGADTVCFFDNKVLTKPNSYDEAFEMIMSYNNKYTEVVTGVCIVEVRDSKVNIEKFYDVTKVIFRNINEDNVKTWLDKGLYMQCSGGFMIEQVEELFDIEYEGSFTNVIGLPMELLTSYLIQLDTYGYDVLYTTNLDCHVDIYRNTARVIPIQDGKVNILKTLSLDKKEEVYYLLGGGIDYNEQPDVACVREVLEESGLIIDNVKKIGVIHDVFKSERTYPHVKKQNHYIHAADVVGITDTNLVDYEKEIFIGVELVDIDEAITIFSNQAFKYKGTKYPFYNIGLGTVQALIKVKTMYGL